MDSGRPGWSTLSLVAIIMAGLLGGGIARRNKQYMCGERVHLLVHDYTRIDPGRLLGFLSCLDEFRRFAKTVESWLEQQKRVP